MLAHMLTIDTSNKQSTFPHMVGYLLSRLIPHSGYLGSARTYEG